MIRTKEDPGFEIRGSEYKRKKKKKTLQISIHIVSTNYQLGQIHKIIVS